MYTTLSFSYRSICRVYIHHNRRQSFINLICAFTTLRKNLFERESEMMKYVVMMLKDLYKEHVFLNYHIITKSRVHVLLYRFIFILAN